MAGVLMKNDKLFETFIHDGKVFIKQLNNIFKKIKEDPDNTDLINQAFRSIHSLKSESSYLNYNNLSEIAHKIENVLDDLREKKISMDEEILNTIFNYLNEIEGTFKKVEQDSINGNPDQIQPSVKHKALMFNDFEIQLLEEANNRGEQFFKMICEIDDSAPLKYPKAYLIINNLELIVNVIKTIPAMDTEVDDAFKQLKIYFTSEVQEKDIQNALSVDQVKIVQLLPLEYNYFIEISEDQEDKKQEKTSYSTPSISIDNRNIEEVLNYIDELKIKLYKLNKIHAHTHKTEINDTDKQQLKKNVNSINSIIQGMERILKKLRIVTLSKELSGFSRLVRDTADQLGKKAELVISGGDIEIDRRLIELIADPLVHLLRNAVDHGIEKPAERIKKGKDETGKIMISAYRDADKLIIQVSDDGEGINKEKVLHRAGELGLSVNSGADEEILSVLTRPGFSTREEKTGFSGRGVGLDAILQKIKQLAGGTLGMESVQDKGTDFIITIPENYTQQNILLIKCGSETIAVKRKYIDKIKQTSEGRFVKDEKGYLYFDDIPVYKINGRLSAGDSNPEEEYLIIINHLGQTGGLLVDELLFEKEFHEDQLRLGTEVKPHLFSFDSSDIKSDCLYLDPSIILNK